jgi:hypothetical protein
MYKNIWAEAIPTAWIVLVAMSVDHVGTAYGYGVWSSYFLLHRSTLVRSSRFDYFSVLLYSVHSETRPNLPDLAILLMVG